jgi:arginase family enzyme
MGLLKNGITIINFDETYSAQRKLQKYSHDELDFRPMKHVNLYCEEDSLQSLKNQLQKRKQKGITFIGSGNYHYVTYLLLKEMTKPFTLVLFDNHPDIGLTENQDHNIVSCGSWVSFALKDIPLLERVVIIGPTTITGYVATDPRIAIFPFDGNHHYSLRSILSVIQTKNIYISIDKDVLNPDEVVTNWDQGVMDIDTLISYFQTILKSKQAEGIDVCGEIRLSPTNTLLPEYHAKIHKNEQANLQILQTCLMLSHSHNIGA